AVPQHPAGHPEHQPAVPGHQLGEGQLVPPGAEALEEVGVAEGGLTSRLDQAVHLAEQDVRRPAGHGNPPPTWASPHTAPLAVSGTSESGGLTHFSARAHLPGTSQITAVVSDSPAISRLPSGAKLSARTAPGTRSITPRFRPVASAYNWIRPSVPTAKV